MLKSGWRQSTLKTYKSAWMRWVRWAEQNHVNRNDPQGSDLARYLIDLSQKEGLSYKTILLHKSVVATLSNTNSSCLSSHILVKHALKAISLKSPVPGKPPIWDVSHLLSYLSNCQKENSSLFRISQLTAILLLLCSGRRVHDLTLLDVTPQHMIIKENCIILWPRFGSKTDSCDYRQSGWKIIANENCQLLDPVYWIKQLVNASQSRRLECSQRLRNALFLTVRGDPKPASRTVIGGWVKALLNEAGIKATPGSVRAAVASKNWVDNFPLDSILAQGNWRSAETFRQFYRREIMQNNLYNENRNNISILFNPV
ncbi:uncharacterized protein LOC132904278 [Amyelois transitella]|uniref:uncharacterized protein LOC132904278 n=1 Tax=Amyelois transitella TaxID=680683 RepID=UPI00298F460C|nr:uncharacterized protein LOC132904278 [Amyelois transitella]